MKPVPILIPAGTRRYALESEKHAVRMLPVSWTAKVYGRLYYLISICAQNGLMTEEIYQLYLHRYGEIKFSYVRRFLTELAAIGLIRRKYVTVLKNDGECIQEVRRKANEKEYDVYWAGWGEPCARKQVRTEYCFLDREHIGPHKYQKRIPSREPVLVQHTFKDGQVGYRVEFK